MKNSNNITLFYKAITVVDAAILDEQYGLMGQSWYLDVKLTGIIDNESVIADFSKIKQKIKVHVDQEVDHRLIIDKKLVQEKMNAYFLSFNYSNGKKHLEYVAPKESLCLLEENFSVKALENHLCNLISKISPSNVIKVECSLREEELDRHFHYTHGLKQHYGNCQRLFHGHRNTIEIFKNGIRNLEWENRIIKEVFKNNVHFAYCENIVKQIINENIALSYKSSQGHYSCILPKEDVFIMPCETTIENISQFFANWIKNNWGEKSDEIEVIAYEGIGKGASFKSN